MIHFLLAAFEATALFIFWFWVIILLAGMAALLESGKK